MNKFLCFIKKNIFLFILFLFGISTILRFIISHFIKLPFVYDDEIYYYQLAESIATGRGLVIHNVTTNFSKMLYSLIISPAFLFSSRSQQQMMVTLINSITISATVFPVYFIAKEINCSKKDILIITFLTIVMPDFCLTMGYMSEVLFLPLATTFLYMLLVLFSKKRNKCYKNVLFGSLCGFVAFLLFVNKEVSLVFIVVIFFFIFEFLIFKLIKKHKINEIFKNYKYRIIEISSLLSVFLILFFVTKYTIFTVESNYSISIMGRIRNLFSIKTFLYFLYAIFYFLIIFSISVFILPIVIPLLRIKNLDRKNKILFILLINLLLISAATISGIISASEDFYNSANKFIPRSHFRYITYLWIPFILVFLNNYKKCNFKFTFKTLIGAIFLILIEVMMYCGVNGSIIDAPILHVFIKYKFVFYIIILLASICYLLCYKKIKISKYLFVIGFCSFQIANNVIVNDTFKKNYVVETWQIQESNKIENFIKENKNLNFLVINTYANPINIQLRISDTFFNYSNVCTTNYKKILNRKSVKIKDEPIVNYDEIKYLVSTIDYIINCDCPIYSNSKNLILDTDVSGSLFDVYKNKENTIIPEFKMLASFGEF